MSERADVFTSKRWRRMERRNAAFMGGFHARTQYCPLRKRQYRNAWLDGRKMREIFDMDSGFFDILTNKPAPVSP